MLRLFKDFKLHLSLKSQIICLPTFSLFTDAVNSFPALLLLRCLCSIRTVIHTLVIAPVSLNKPWQAQQTPWEKFNKWLTLWKNSPELSCQSRFSELFGSNPSKLFTSSGVESKFLQLSVPFSADKMIQNFCIYNSDSRASASKRKQE